MGGQVAWAGQQIVVKLNLARSLADAGRGTSRWASRALGGYVHLDDRATIHIPAFVGAVYNSLYCRSIEDHFSIASPLSHCPADSSTGVGLMCTSRYRMQLCLLFCCHLIRPPPRDDFGPTKSSPHHHPRSFQVVHQSSVRADHASSATSPKPTPAWLHPSADDCIGNFRCDSRQAGRKDCRQGHTP